MFHGKHVDDRLDRAAQWAGVHLGDAQHRTLAEYGQWLATEGVAAGGLGPLEPSRIVDRHLADSLVFAGAWGDTPDRILDVGSGVGLPGIPLAIVHPGTTVVLLDRSERRCVLARRATRVLGLQNVAVEQRDVMAESREWPALVFRASFTPDRAITLAEHLLERNGCAVIGLSRTEEPESVPPPPPRMALDLLKTAPGVLDSPAWLLRMRRTEPRMKDGTLP